MTAAKITSRKDGEGGKRGRGQPSIYSEELATRICTRIASGESLKTICGDEAMPGLTTVFRWLAGEDHLLFRDQYARAREAQMEALAEEILEIADDSSGDKYVDADGKERIDHENVARSRVRIDARKWLMSKLASKKYGDKLDLTVDDKQTQTPEARRDRIAELLAMGTVKTPGDGA